MSVRKGVLLFAAAALLLSFAVPAFASGSGEKAAGGKIYIPVISKGFQHQFWQTVKKGAEAAAAQYGVQITFEGPPTEADIQPQVQMLVNDMAKNPAAICLAALDTNSVMDQLNQALQRKIPIIGFDSGVPNAPMGAIYATAATNSYAAAGLAADKMFAVIKDKISAASDSSPVTIVDFNQDATSQSVTDRGKGFRDEMIKLITTQTSHSKADIAVVGNPAYIAADTPTSGKSIIIDVQVPASPKDTDATNTASAILNRVKDNNVLGIFCSNEGTARAVLAATNDGSALPSQYPGLVVIGFDAGKAQKAAIRNKYFLGAITQDPYNIGFKAVELAVQAVKGQKVANVDTGAKFYDSTNIDNPDIAQLVYD
jgi:ribose transport system substrate-binding protein